MHLIYERAKGKTAVLVSPSDLMSVVGERLNLSSIEKIVSDLSSDGYFELVYSERSGERVYCVSLTKKGNGYMRDKKIFKRNLAYRVMLTVSLALLSFVIGLILKAVF